MTTLDVLVRVQGENGQVYVKRWDFDRLSVLIHLLLDIVRVVLKLFVFFAV